MQDFALLGTALDCDFDHDIPGKAASFQPVEHVQRWVKAGQDSYTRRSLSQGAGGAGLRANLRLWPVQEPVNRG